jgi:hypothetical protein
VPTHMQCEIMPSGIPFMTYAAVWSSRFATQAVVRGE